jgi:ubiquitin-protein ligase E3 C
MFCAPELQILLSGSLTGVSAEDLKNSCNYAGGYHALDSRIRWFWECVKEMNEKDRGLLLKFVTSCERPPSLGISFLDPPFTIQKVDISDDARLPTASTCFNVLKLPSYSSKMVLKSKLLAAIHSGAGFDLS